jgi:hypothetical protein
MNGHKIDTKNQWEMCWEIEATKFNGKCVGKLEDTKFIGKCFVKIKTKKSL